MYTVKNVGGGIGQDPATKVTHLRLNQPPVSSSEVAYLGLVHITCDNYVITTYD